MATKPKATKGKSATKAKASTKPRKGGQSGIFDRTSTDKTLAAHCRDYFESVDPRPSATRKKNRDAKAAIDAALGTMKPALRDREVVRVGEYMITNTLRSGGGFTVKTWGPKPTAGIRRAQ
jgi:hypothetical protein